MNDTMRKTVPNTRLNLKFRRKKRRRLGFRRSARRGVSEDAAKERGRVEEGKERGESGPREGGRNRNEASTGLKINKRNPGRQI